MDDGRAAVCWVGAVYSVQSSCLTEADYTHCHVWPAGEWAVYSRAKLMKARRAIRRDYFPRWDREGYWRLRTDTVGHAHGTCCSQWWAREGLASLPGGRGQAGSKA